MRRANRDAQRKWTQDHFCTHGSTQTYATVNLDVQNTCDTDEGGGRDLAALPRVESSRLPGCGIAFVLLRMSRHLSTLLTQRVAPKWKCGMN
jgi:hypothetical protein